MHRSPYKETGTRLAGKDFHCLLWTQRWFITVFTRTRQCNIPQSPQSSPYLYILYIWSPF